MDWIICEWCIFYQDGECEGSEYKDGCCYGIVEETIEDEIYDV